MLLITISYRAVWRRVFFLAGYRPRSAQHKWGPALSAENIRTIRAASMLYPKEMVLCGL